MTTLDSEIDAQRVAVRRAEEGGRTEDRNHAVAVLEGLLKARRIAGVADPGDCPHLVHDPFEMVDERSVWRCRECGTRAEVGR